MSTGARHAQTSTSMLVDFLLERGNRLRNDPGEPEIRWRNDKEGQHVYLQNPVDFDSLNEHFTFASDVRLRELSVCRKGSD